MYVITCVYMCIHIYIEREREIYRYIERESELLVNPGELVEARDNLAQENCVFCKK